MKVVWLQIDLGKLFVRDLSPNGVLAVIQAACFNRVSIVFTVAAVAFRAEPFSVQKSLQEGRSLLPEDAAKLESALQANPEDAVSRARLLGYYSGLAASANPDNAATARAIHLAHLEWVVEHHPESGLAAEDGPTPDEFEPLKQIWLRQADHYSQDLRVVERRAIFRRIGRTGRLCGS